MKNIKLDMYWKNFIKYEDLLEFSENTNYSFQKIHSAAAAQYMMFTSVCAFWSQVSFFPLLLL